MIKEEQIKILVEEKIAGSDKFLVSVKIKPGNIIRVYIDGDKGVNVGDCALISRYITSKLDRDTEDFELEVSSAGITVPFTLERQYRKNIGRNVKVVTKEGIVICGMLKSADAQSFVVIEKKTIKKPKSTEEIDHKIQYSDTKETKLVI